jgi:hypothetical protein
MVKGEPQTRDAGNGQRADLYLVFCTEHLFPTKPSAGSFHEWRGVIYEIGWQPRLKAGLDENSPSAGSEFASQGGYQATDSEH